MRTYEESSFQFYTLLKIRPSFCVCERNNSSIMMIKPYADENSILVGKISLSKSTFTPVCGTSKRYQSLVIIYGHTMLEELASTYNKMIFKFKVFSHSKILAQVSRGKKVILITDLH